MVRGERPNRVLERVGGVGAIWFVAAVFVFQFAVWNARIGNSDSLQQLISTVHVVQTGHLGITTEELRDEVIPATPTGGPSFESLRGRTAALWVHAPNGRWYQVHDPGNKVLMAPAAVAARLVGSQHANPLDPTALTKLLVAATTAAFGAFLPFFLFLGLRTAMPDFRAMRWAALGLVATILLPFSKATWDVFPCAVVVAGVVWLSIKRLAGGTPRWHTVGLFLLAGVASWFRFSVGPFLLLGCVLTEVVAAGRPARQHLRTSAARVTTGLGVYLIVIAPVLAINARATGNAWKPPTTLYDETGKLFATFPLRGAMGLLAAPNRGLFIFAPVMIVLFGVFFWWKRFPAFVRSYTAVWAVPVAGYLLAVGSIESWGTLGWGPRYLVPIVPILWVPTALVGARALDGSRPQRVAVVALIVTSVLISTSATLTNWDAVASTEPSVWSSDTRYPKQIIETIGYTGRRVPLADDTGDDAGIDTKEWPDLAVVYATRKAGLPDAAGYLGFLLLLAVATGLFVRADRSLRRHTLTDTSFVT